MIFAIPSSYDLAFEVTLLSPCVRKLQGEFSTVAPGLTYESLPGRAGGLPTFS